MLKLRVTMTRPSTSVPFFQPDGIEGFTEVLNSYAAQGKLMARETDVMDMASAHPLTLTISTTWRSVAENEEFLADPITLLVRDARIQYCTENDILVEYVREVVADEFDSAEEPAA